MLETDETDRSKKSVIPVATTEQRIRFKEVQLKPKSQDPPLDPFIHENPGPPADAADPNPNIVVDRITGKFVPVPTRAAKGKGKKKRKKKAAVTDKEREAKTEDKGVGKGDVTMADQAESVGPPDQGDPMDVGDG